MSNTSSINNTGAENALSPFLYSDTNKRYHTFDYDLKHRFGGKVCKIPLDIGCTCPNIDGKKGVGGCIYCSPRGSGDFAPEPSVPLDVQYKTGRDMMGKKWEDAKALVYFQAHTNTYGDFDFITSKIEQAVNFEGVVGASIATRADCIDQKWADYLRDLSKRTFLTVELGLQSVHDQTAELINRCHTFDEFMQGYSLISDLNICIHLINGLPGEDRQMMIENARVVGKLHPYAIKLHLLHILRYTPLAQMYYSGLIKPMTLEEYAQTVCDQLEVLPPEVVLERVTGDGAPDDLIAPDWSRKKFTVMNEIDKEMVRRDSMQGKNYK